MNHNLRMSCSRAKNMGTTETKAEQEDAFLLSHLTSSPCRAEDKKMCDFLTCAYAYTYFNTCFKEQ